MNGKTIRNFLVIYLIILFVVIVAQLPKNNLSADEPSYKVEIDDENLDRAIVMNINSPVVLVGSEQNIIDSTDVDVVPKIVNGRTYVPVQFFKNILNSRVSWNANKKETTIRYNNKAVVFTSNSDDVKVIDNDTEKSVHAVGAPLIIRERMYVPLRISLESFGKHLIYKDGLIIISDFDLELDDAVIDELIVRTSKLPVVGTEKNFEILMGEPQNNVRYLYDGEYYDVAVEEEVGSSLTGGAPKTFNAAASRSATVLEAAAADEDESYSKTNVQVEGVDEGDLVKTDGEYIYYVKNNSVEIVKANPPEDMDIMSVIKPMSKLYGKNCGSPNVGEIFISGNNLVVLGEAYMTRDYTKYESVSEETTEITEYSSSAGKEIFAGEVYDYYYGGMSDCTFADIYDISDKSNPVLKKQLIADGMYVSSRLTDNCIYIVSNVSIDRLVYNKRYIPPLFYDSTLDKEPKEIGFSDICYIPEKTSRNYMNITGADLSDINKPAFVYTTVASGDEVYMSLDNLYVADGNDSTEIYKYELDKGRVNYKAHGKAEGRLHNQFAMDEKDGYLRLTTSEYKSGRKTNNLFVLDDKLDKVSEIRNIAENEDIHSTRFMGNRAYMVTFETVDPLFVIDVSDPLKPKILGALKIPGYSDYLHPYDENHLIGIGKDTFVYKDMAYYKGMKLSMFDVTDVSAPKELFTEIIGDRGTESEVLDNHRALLFDKEKNILAFPVEIFTVPDEEKNHSDNITSSDLQYGTFSFQGFVRYSVDMDEGFKQESKTTHLDSEDMLKSGNYGGAYDKYIKRGLFIGDHLYTISNYKIVSESLKDGKEEGSIVLE